MDINLNFILLIVGQVIGLVVWLARLESKVKYCEKQIDILTIKHESLDSELVKELAKLKESLARIEGFLSAKKDN